VTEVQRARQVMFEMVKPHRGRLLLAAIGLVVAASAALALGQGLRSVIDQGFAAGDPRWLDRALGGSLALVVVLAGATWLRFYNVSWLGERVSADLRTRVYAHLLTLPPSVFEAGRTGEVISRLTNDTAQIENVVGSTLSIALRNTLLLVGGLVMLALTSGRLTLLVLAGVPLVVAPIVIFGRRVRALSRERQARVADLGTHVDESVHAIRIVQACGHEAADRDHFTELVERSFDTGVKRYRHSALMVVMVILLVFGSVAVILWVGGHDVLQGRLTAGELSAFVFYAAMVASSVGALSEVWGELQRAAGATERLIELLDTQPDITAPPSPRALPQPARGDITFRDVRFCYPSRPDIPALDGFSIDVRAGETVALVGRREPASRRCSSCCCASTIRSPAWSRIDGVPLAEADPADVRGRIALVPQEAVIFAASVADNVRYARPEASNEQVRAACEAAFADAFIRALPGGYDSPLGERGVRLSGGQRQRIAIARAILADRPILLLDEATSALDAESERMVQAALAPLMASRTTLVVAHRLATVQRADRIVVLDHGRPVETGTHAALLARDGLYAKLARLQFIDE
jgi:ATP-binding cassette subfamily B protein